MPNKRNAMFACWSMKRSKRSILHYCTNLVGCMILNLLLSLPLDARSTCLFVVAILLVISKTRKKLQLGTRSLPIEPPNYAEQFQKIGKVLWIEYKLILSNIKFSVTCIFKRYYSYFQFSFFSKINVMDDQRQTNSLELAWCFYVGKWPPLPQKTIRISGKTKSRLLLPQTEGLIKSCLAPFKTAFFIF